MSGAYGKSVTHHKNGKPRTALQFLIDYCKENGIVLVTDLAHPCRSGKATNCLTQAEVDAFLKLCYKIMAHHCFLGKSTKEVLKEKEENATATIDSLSTGH